MQLSINAIKDKNGAIIAYIGVGTDITKLTEVIGVAMAFTEYASYGTYETAQIIEKKLNQGSE